MTTTTRSPSPSRRSTRRFFVLGMVLVSFSILVLTQESRHVVVVVVQDNYNTNDDRIRNSPSKGKRPPLSETLSAMMMQQSSGFPRWGDERGIDLEFIQLYLAQTTDLSAHYYVFGGKDYYYNTSTPNRRRKRKKSARRQEQQQPQIWVANRRRREYPRGALKDRVQPVEKLLQDALDYYLLDRHKAENTNQQQPKWPRLEQVVPTSGLPLLFQFGDYQGCNRYNYLGNMSLPIFTVCAYFHEYNCNYSWPLPSYKLLEHAQHPNFHQDKTWHHQVSNKVVKSITHSNPDSFENFFQAQDKAYPWHQKIRKVVWRGSNTGSSIKDKVLRKNMTKQEIQFPMRWRMVYEATKTANNNNSSNFFDVGFSSVSPKKKLWYPNTSNGIKGDNNVTQFLPLAPPMGEIDNQKYIAILDVDGNSWSSRFSRLLAMNSVVIKIEPEFADYYMTRLIPWVHYVPVRMDSSDLIDVVKYVLDPQNDQEMQQIVQNAHAWVQTNLRYQQLVVDTLEILEAYVQKLDRHDRNWTNRFSAMMTNPQFLEEKDMTPLAWVD